LITKKQGNESLLQTFLSDQGLIWEYNNQILHREMLRRNRISHNGFLKQKEFLDRLHFSSALNKSQRTV
jgi:hypothetical protein